MSLHTSLKRRLAANPRATGALFALLILLTQVGFVVAGDGSSVGGT